MDDQDCQPVPYFRFDLSEWRSGKISRRPLIERALLLEIMLNAFAKGGWMPWGALDREDFAVDQAIQLEQLEGIVAGFEARGIVVIDGDRITTKFVLATVAKVQAIREKRSRAGAKGGAVGKKAEASDKQVISKCLANAGALLSNASNTNTNTSTVTDSSTVEDKETVTPPMPENINPAPGIQCPAFTAFWKAYPRAMAKQKTADAWNAAIMAGATPRQIMDGIKTCPQIKRSLDEGNADMVPASYSYLQDARWEDKMTETVSKPKMPKEWL